MKTRIAAVLILIYELFAAGFISKGISPRYTCSGIEPIPPYATPLLLIASFLLLIAACTLFTKITKAVWFSCVALAFINLGIMCWGIVYYLGTRCYGQYQITPDTGAAKVTIYALVIITLALVLLLSDIKRIHRITTENLKNQTASLLLKIILSIIVYVLIIIMIYAATGGVYGSCRTSAYNSVRDDTQNAVVAYMTDHSSQLPIISSNATFTLTHPNGSYYIINMSALLTVNGGMLRQVPDGCSQIPGPDNDNCDGGAPRCSNTSHYIWGMDNHGNVVSQPVNTSDHSTANETQCNACNYCQCDTCDGYQGVWP